MALRSSTLLLVLGLIIGSLAVAQASRGLLNDDDKCYPKEYYYKGVYYPKESVKECPKGNPEDCYYVEPVYDEYGHPKYAKVSKKDKYECYYGDYDQLSISYYDQWGKQKCYKGYGKDEYFEAQCDSYIKFNIVDPKYYNKDGKKVKYSECGYYEPCNICDYPSSYKVKCEDKKEEKEPEYDDKNGKRNLLTVGDNKVGRELLDDGKDKKEDKDKCYPYTYNYKKQEKCPYGYPEDCFKVEYYDGYVKVSKKDNYYKCFADYDKFVISYTDKYTGYAACTDGKKPFYPKCKEEVKYYVLDQKYYNENGKKIKKEYCNEYYYPKYPECSVCDYKPVKYDCKKKEKYYDD